jgi:transposase
VWLLRSGAPWRDLPDTSVPGGHRQRFYRWRRQGVFDRLLAEVTRRADVLGELDWLRACNYLAWSSSPRR